MTAGGAYRRPLQHLVEKHEPFYSSHLIDVMIANAAESFHLQRELSEMQRAHAVELGPALQRAREESAALAAKVERVRPQQEREEERLRLSSEAAELRREVAALRSSSASKTGATAMDSVTGPGTHQRPSRSAATTRSTGWAPMPSNFSCTTSAVTPRSAS